MLGRTRTAHLGLFAAAGALALSLALVPAAFAGKGGGGHGKPGGGTTGGSGTLALVVVSSPSNDGLPHYSGQITYSVSTTATLYPYVSTSCYQGTTQVLSDSAGFFVSYPWPSDQTLTLRTMLWTSGAADCTATLYSMDSGSKQVLATFAYHAYA
jgi:hypothetical protein